MVGLHQKCEKTIWESEDQERLANEIIDLLVGEVSYPEAIALLERITNELFYLNSMEKVSRF